ncbi:S-type anion channel SLAH3-like [Telopea speciosissima]|uniref:S-type anion channel SLAH3-like n=1 Tax=Telopea speciosissima TaxID=54955 RepID=UPI001CC7E53A|nr:S-type anion channel SLAH3-like [Telopea speciosissima]
MDRRFINSFKTWSGELERQLSILSGKQIEPEPEPEPEVNNVSQNAEIEILPVNRYFDALEGPELGALRDSDEELVLLEAEDKKWPFLLRFPINSFGICLGIGSQAVLWRDLSTTKSMSFLHISLTVNLVTWCIALALVLIVSFIYSLKLIFYFEAVRREFFHPIRVNFFFAPWIAALFLAISLPPLVATFIHTPIWYILMIPILCLDLKIFGQWMSGSQRRLSMVANPANHIAIVSNFLGSYLGASMGLKEGPIFFFAIGLAHYIVLFVTLFQKLPTNQTLPKDLHPVFFLFLSTPSVASISWALIQGVFDYGARIPFFLSLFLYFTLAVRINFFRGFRFSLTWWAYTFPMSGVSIASVAYSDEVTTLFTKILTVALSGISTLVVIIMLITTIFHAFVLRDLFPNDKAIAISEKRSETGKKQFHLRSRCSDTQDIEASLKAAESSDDESRASDAYIDIGN